MLLCNYWNIIIEYAANILACEEKWIPFTEKANVMESLNKTDSNSKALFQASKIFFTSSPLLILNIKRNSYYQNLLD